MSQAILTLARPVNLSVDQFALVVGHPLTALALASASEDRSARIVGVGLDQPVCSAHHPSRRAFLKSASACKPEARSVSGGEDLKP
jgi:hypothetical protein